MTQEIEILLKKEMFNKTFKNILHVRVWSSKEDVNILGKKITISIEIDMKSATTLGERYRKTRTCPHCGKQID